jgi:alanine racemase
VTTSYKTWVEISASNLIHNISQIRNLLRPGTKLAGVIKANAYGHGVIEVAKIIQNKIDFFAVDSIDEALWLKNGGAGKPILILGYTLLSNLPEIVENNFHQVVSSIETIQELDRITKIKNKEAFIHLKIETGTSRQGIYPKDLPAFVESFKKNPLLKLAGVSTHYANIEDTADHSFAENQLQKYNEAIALIKAESKADFYQHTACSAAIILFPETHFNFVRLGISLYGLWSSPSVEAEAKHAIDLKPVLSWKSRVAQIKTLPAGATVSYGCTEKVEKPTRTAVIPVGYYDGFDRKNSSIGHVLIRGNRCKVLGRVCMNMFVVNVDEVSDVAIEDEVVIIGRQNKEEITADEFAQKIGTINYEAVTRINPLLPRIIVT